MCNALQEEAPFLPEKAPRMTGRERKHSADQRGKELVRQYYLATREVELIARSTPKQMQRRKQEQLSERHPSKCNIMQRLNQVWLDFAKTILSDAPLDEMHRKAITGLVYFDGRYDSRTVHRVLDWGFNWLTIN